MKAIFDRHERAVLHFSGGKDSLACLWLIEPWWDKTTVLWANAGAAFPETERLMEQVRGLVPHFDVVRTDARAWAAEHGLPRDRDTSGFRCCRDNLMLPAWERTRALGATLVVRGQKDADRLKGPLRSGALIDGVEFLYPIEDWTDLMVLAFLRATPTGLPEHYAITTSGLDCWHCTAYDHDAPGKLAYMKARHPRWHTIVQEARNG